MQRGDSAPLTDILFIYALKICAGMNDVVRAGALLRDENIPLAKRFRALFALRSIPTDESVAEIEKAFSSPSVLLKHELAYVLGQMQNRSALEVLVRVLEDKEENEIARHEAAEAIANFGDVEYLSLLEKYANVTASESTPVSETCQIGVELIRRGKVKESPFGSLDPAPADEESSIQNLEDIYLDERKSLYKRYMALFRLRNLLTDEAVDIIGRGLYCRNRSVLFEHEVAFVFGQMQMPSSIPYLRSVLADKTRHEMVRHECAEALGSVGGEEALSILVEFQNDESAIVRESVEVALDIHLYRGSDEFEYAVV
jgi:deoxyhypusine monooxygenase